MSFIKYIIRYYNRIPIGFLNMFAPLYSCLPEKIRLTPFFTKEKKELERINNLTVDEITKERQEKLRQLISYAYNHVPYYRNLFDREGIAPEDIRTEDDLKRIPLLTKELLVANRETLLSDEFEKKDLIYITTSGSTGTPTGLYVQKDSHIRDWVYVYHMFGKYGFNPKSSKLVLRGKTFREQRKGKIYQWDALKKELSINIFDMTEQNMEMYCKMIEKYKPDFAYGYMSAMYTLCKYMEHRKEKLCHKFKGFIGISETITDEQKKYVEKIMEAPVLTFYGMSERVVIAAQSPVDGEYYVEPLYGIAELVDKNGKAIVEPGIQGEIVGTSLLNHAMPLIRYKMDDMSSWSNKNTQNPGDFYLTPILGRSKKDVLINKEGQTVSMASLEIHSKIYSYMARYQFVQTEVGKVVIKAVLLSTVNYSEQIEKEIIKTFTDRVLGKIDFTVEIVDEILPKANGKLSIIDQGLDVSKYI